ncbi:hypothetical protein Tco_0315591 [Tanacetum coccineum]
MCMTIKLQVSKEKERCMDISFDLFIHTFKFYSKDDLKRHSHEYGFKRALCHSLVQDVVTFHSLLGGKQQFQKFTQFKVYIGFESQIDRHILCWNTLDSRLTFRVYTSSNTWIADDADIRPIYDEELMAEVQLTVECNIYAIGQQHTEQPKIIVEGRVDQYPETCQVKSPMLDSSPDNQTTEYSKQSLESENILLKETVAQFKKIFFKNGSR